MERIKSLPRGVAHTVLLAICNDPSTLRRAIDLVDLVEAPQSPVGGDDDDGYDEDEVEIVGVAPKPNRKRKISSDGVTIRAADLFRCDVCKKPFLASRNRHGACKYHEGELEPDLECGLWDDHVENPDVWGDIDTRENIREHPEGFYWDCCGKRADDSGCQADYHTSAGFSGSSVAKRSRLDGSADGGQAAYANDPIDVRDDGDDDDDSVVEVAAPLVTIYDGIDEDPPEELEEDPGFGARIVNGEVVIEVALHQEAKTVVAVSDNDSPKAGGEVQTKDEAIQTEGEAIQTKDEAVQAEGEAVADANDQ